MPGYELIPTAKWVRARLGGLYVADSRRAKLVKYGPYPRTYAFPLEDVAMDNLVVQDGARQDERFGRLRSAAIKVNGTRIDDAARLHAEGELAGHVTLDWDKMDAWFEEDEPVFVHPRDPNHRIDVRHSSRHVVVKKDGITLAESHHPTLLFETGLPVRYYLPPTDVNAELLRPNEKTSGCPYKGFANYYDLEMNGQHHEGLVWEYRTPLPGMHRIMGLLCFFNEKVDMTVDGALQERPKTPWSE